MMRGQLKGRDEELLDLPEKLEKRLLPFQRDGVKFALSRAGRSVNKHSKVGCEHGEWCQDCRNGFHV